MVHMCNMISSVFFHFFKSFFFGVIKGVKAKNGPKNDKKFSVILHISGTIHHMIVIHGTHL